MTYGTGRLFWRLITNRFTKSARQWMLLLMLVLFATFAALFHSAVKEVHNEFIAGLKGLYPTTYMPTAGTVPPADKTQFLHLKEIFLLSETLRFRYVEADSDRLLMDIGIRGFTPERVPTAITHTPTAPTGPDTLWVSPSLFNHLAASSLFDGTGIYLTTESGHATYVHVNKACLQGDTFWVVLPLSVAERVYLYPNITTIYTRQGTNLSENQIKDKYVAMGRHVMNWTDKLPYFHTVVHSLSQRYFAMVIATFFIPVLFLFSSVMADTLHEVGMFVSYGYINGIGKHRLLRHILLFISGYIYLIAGLALLLYKVLSHGLSSIFNVPLGAGIPELLFVLGTPLIAMPAASLLFLWHRTKETQITGGT